MIVAQNISKEFKRKNGSVVGLKPLHCTLDEGRRYALVGESGSGKTTLSRILSGVLPPDTGEIRVDGENIKDKIRKKTLYCDVQLVLQNAQSSLNPSKTVAQIISEPLKHLAKFEKKKIPSRVEQLLSQVELSSELATRYPHQLSGGQQKRVAIARALAANPRYIIFDEAVSGLDLPVQNSILTLLLKLQDSLSCTYLFITHDITVALYLCQEIWVMKDGEMVERCECNRPDQFQHPYSKLLINSALLN